MRVFLRSGIEIAFADFVIPARILDCECAVVDDHHFGNQVLLIVEQRARCRDNLDQASVQAGLQGVDASDAEEALNFVKDVALNRNGLKIVQFLPVWRDETELHRAAGNIPEFGGNAGFIKK